MPENYAAVQPAEKTNVEVKAVPTPSPGPHDLLVRNQSIAFNPLEWKLQKLAIFPMQYPYIGGFSFGGTVEKLGTEVTNVKVGDRIAARKKSSVRTGNEFGVYQRYALIQDDSVVIVPESVHLDAASAVVLNLATTVGLLIPLMGLERMSLSASSAPAPKSKKILVYGGSSSVGQFAIQLASQAGYPVISTSSPGNMKIVEPLGAKSLVNHSQEPADVIKELAAQGPYDFVVDTVALPPTTAIVCAVIEQGIHAGGTDTFWGLQPLFGPEHVPASVKRMDGSYAGELEKPENKDLSKWFFEELVPKGLASGKIVPPQIEKLPGGLSAVQTAIEMMMKGVSGKKLIVNPWDE